MHGGVVPENQLNDVGMAVKPLSQGNYGLIFQMAQQGEMARIKAVLSGEAEESDVSPAVSNTVNINGQWTDITLPASKGERWYCYTNNKYGGSARVYIWAAFSSEQSFNISRYGGIQEGGVELRDRARHAMKNLI